MKSAVLASALVAVSSVFAGNITAPWFTKTPTGSEGSIDCELNDPVIVNGNAAAVANYYAVTANVSIIIHAACPQPGELTLTEDNNTFYPKGSICAAYDNNDTAKWYGLTYENSTYAWTELKLAGGETPFSTPSETTYTLVTEFNDETKVRYSVISGNTTQTSDWLTSGHNDPLKKVGLAGTGTYTKIIGLIAYSVAQTTGTIPIAIDTSTLNDMGVTATTASEIVSALTTPELNGIAKWANYALGIDGTVKANKPFAAPVQNSTASTLTFKLGGVSARTDVADVKYAIETLDSPNGDVKATSTAVAAGTDQTITLESSKVKYYRVKVQIDAKSN